MRWWLLIGFLVLVVLGILLVYYWFYDKKENKKEEGFQSQTQDTSEGNKQVYAIGPEVGSINEGTSLCGLNGARLATLSELHDAIDDGAHFCVPGWVSGMDTVTYAVVGTGKFCNGTIGPAVIKYFYPSSKYGYLSRIWGYYKSKLTNPLANHEKARDHENPRFFNGGYGHVMLMQDNFQNEKLDATNKENNTNTYSRILNKAVAFCYGFRPPAGTPNLYDYDYDLFRDSNNMAVDPPYHAKPGSSSGQPGKTPVDITRIVNTPYNLNQETIFDDATGTRSADGKKTYTLFDLDGITNQANAIMADVNDKYKADIATENNNPNIQYQYDILISASQDHNTSSNSMFSTYSKAFNTNDPYIYNPYSLMGTINLSTPPQISAYKAIRLNNIRGYYNNITNILSTNPTLYLHNGLINRPVYLNDFFIIDRTNFNGRNYSKHIPIFNVRENGDQGIQQGWEFVKYPDGKYYRRIAPDPNVPMRDIHYGKNSCPGSGTVFTNEYHCPGGGGPNDHWWRAEYTRGLDGCNAGWYYTLWMTPNPIFTCIKEWPIFKSKIFSQDVRLSSSPKFSYPTTTKFLGKSDTWAPHATSAEGQQILEKFTLAKQALATRYGTTLQKAYRWKPVSYYGDITEINKSEIYSSVSLSVLFNFSNDRLIETQIRISAENLNLYYSTDGTGKPEFESNIDKTQNPPKVVTTAVNTKYNNMCCNTQMSLAELSLLPYHTRQKIVTWASLRLTRLSAGYSINNVTVVEGRINKQAVIQAQQNAESTSYMLRQAQLNPRASSVSLAQLQQFDISANRFFTDISGKYWAQPSAAATTSAFFLDSVNEATTGAFGAAAAIAANQREAISFTDENPITSTYNITTSKLFTSIPQTMQHKLLDSMAQLFYNLNNGEKSMYKVLDIFQVGVTIFDVRYEERKVLPNAQYTQAITDLKAKYNSYKTYNLSETELITLESEYNDAIQNLYRELNSNVFGNATNCGLRARYIRITCIGSAVFNFSQVMVINNAGTNVAYYSETKSGPRDAQGNDTSTYLLDVEDLTGSKQYNFATNSLYSDTETNYINTQYNELNIQNKLALLTDGTYTPRNFPTYRSNGKQSGQYIQIDLASLQDISVVQIIYKPDTKVNEYQIDLLDSLQNPLQNTEIQSSLTFKTTYNASGTQYVDTPGKVTVNFKTQTDSERTALSLPLCPNDIYGVYNVARFYGIFPGDGAAVRTTVEMQSNGFPIYTITTGSATPDTTTTIEADITNLGYVRIADPTLTTPVKYFKFIGFSIGTDAALTFNHMYNAGNVVDTSSPSGNILYQPFVQYSKNIQLDLNPCNNRDRIIDIFRDFVLQFNNNNFIERADAKANGYNDGNTHTPTTVTDYATINSYRNSICAYKWTETTAETKETKTMYGTFIYKPDTENWQSLDSVYDVSNSRVYSALNSFNLDPLNKNMSMTPITPAITLPVAYSDSNILTTNGGQCPGLDCSSPFVINSLISNYNQNEPVHSGIASNILRDTATGKAIPVLRVGKALTTSSESCEYEVQIAKPITINGVATNTVKVKILINLDDSCKYTFQRGTTMKEVDRLTDQSPFLTRAYQYVQDTMKPFTNAFRSVYSDLSGMLQVQTKQDLSGSKWDLMQYRTITNTAAGQIRSAFRQQYTELDVFCPGTKCSDQPIRDSFLQYYRQLSQAQRIPTDQMDIVEQNTVITNIMATGMDASGNCDFTVSTAPVTVTANSAGTDITAGIDITRGKTVGLKAKIKRYFNSCQYFVDTSQPLTSINPIPTIGDVSDVIRNDIIFTTRYLRFSITQIRNPALTNFSFTGFQLQRNGIPIPWNSTATSSAGPEFFYPLDTSGNYVLTADQYSYNVNNGIVPCNRNYNFSIINGIYTCTYTAPDANRNKPITGALNTYITIDNKVPITFTSYSWGMSMGPPQPQSQNDQDPINWLLESSTDGLNWQPLHDKTKVSEYFNHTNLTFIPPVYPPSVAKGTKITSAAIESGTDASIYNSPNTNLPVSNSQSVSNQGPLESIDYIKCDSNFALKQILTKTTIGSITSIGNLNPLTCLVNGSSQYRFSKGTGTNMLTSVIQPTIQVARSTAIATKNFNPALRNADVTLANPNPALATDSDCSALSAITGYNTVSDSKFVSGNMCEFKVSNDTSLVYGDIYKRISFYFDSTTRLASSVPATPAGSVYSVFNQTLSAVPSDFNNIVYFLYFTWNYAFYFSSPGQTEPVWKIGDVKKVGFLQDNDGDSIVFEATGTQFGKYGQYDVRDSADGPGNGNGKIHYFKFTLRRETTGSQTFNGINVKLYSKSDSSSSYGSYIGFVTPSSGSIIINESYYTIIDPNNNPPPPPDIRITLQIAVDIKFNSTLKKMYPIQEFANAKANGPFRFIRFKVTATTASKNGSRVRGAEIARLMLYDPTDRKDANGNILFPRSYDSVQLPNAIVSVQDISSNYLLGSSNKFSCDVGFRTLNDPIRGIICKYIKKDNDTKFEYNIIDNYLFNGRTGTNGYNSYSSDVQCGIGYMQISEDNPVTKIRTCQATGNFFDLVTDPVTILNPGTSWPRLKLDINQYVTIDLGDYKSFVGFSFITGSDATAPLQWSFEGSLNNVIWTVLHSQTTDFNYTSSPNIRTVNSIPIRSFFNPGIFPTSNGTTFGNNPNGTIANNSVQTMNYSQLYTYPQFAGNITEGFKSEDFKPGGSKAEGFKSEDFKSGGSKAEGFKAQGSKAQGSKAEGFKAELVKPSKPIETMKFVEYPVALEPSYDLPLNPTAPNREKSTPLTIRSSYTQITQTRRFQYLRFKILETHDPASKFVNMSQFEFHTRSGILSPNCFKFSNPQGSRKNPTDGVQSLLGTRSNRWVDFNKSELIVQFDTQILPDTPIIGFKFAVPEAVGGVGAFPSKWTLLGSYDKHTWITLHEQLEPARLIGTASPVYKFYEEI